MGTLFDVGPFILPRRPYTTERIRKIQIKEVIFKPLLIATEM